jgi:hypothetical protein
MSIRSVLGAGLVAAALALGAGARADDSSKTPDGHGGPSQACSEHAKAMHGMKTPEQREAYCRAHSDCMSHNCGGMGSHKHGQTPPVPPEPGPQKPKS